ncbi:hypothetical protein KC721_00360 [Candidatus Woesebacteria bacterium]|nr:hypothetical protein [Candidatus Woesebacteria bacterium]
MIKESLRLHPSEADTRFNPSQAEVHPYTVGEVSGSIQINNKGSILDGMELPIYNERPWFSPNEPSALLSAMQDPVRRLVLLVEDVTNQSFTQGNQTYRGEGRKALIHRILVSVTDSEEYARLIDGIASRSSGISQAVISATIQLLSNTNYLEAVIGSVVDGSTNSTSHRRSRNFEAAMRAASWQVQQERDPGFNNQTLEGHYSVQTVLDSKMMADLAMDFWKKQQENLLAQAESTPFGASAEQELTLFEATGNKAWEMSDESLHGSETTQRFELDFRAAVVGVTILNKIALIREATDFLNSSGWDHTTTPNQVRQNVSRTQAQFQQELSGSDPNRAFLRLQEVFRLDPSDPAVLTFLFTEFGLASTQISELTQTQEGRKDLEKIIKRARAIVTHGFTRDENHHFSEISFDSKPRHFIILVHGSPYKIEYYNSQGFVSQEEILRIVRELEYRHSTQSTDPQALQQRQTVDGIWTSLSYNPKKNIILSDPVSLGAFIRKYLKSEYKNSSDVVSQIAYSIRALATADFSVSIGANEVPAFGKDDLGGEMTPLVFGGHHIDVSEISGSLQINSQFDHGILDGREAQETNAELVFRLHQIMLAPESVLSSATNASGASFVERLCLGEKNGEMFFSDLKIPGNTNEHCDTLPDLPAALVNSPKSLTEELGRSLTETVRNELEDRLQALEKMTLKELFEETGSLIDECIDTAVAVQTKNIAPRAWEEHLLQNPDITKKSPKAIQAIKNVFYDDLEAHLYQAVCAFLSGDHELMAEISNHLNLVGYDFSVPVGLYGGTDLSQLSAVEYSLLTSELNSLATKTSKYDLLSQYEQISTFVQKLKQRLVVIEKQRQEATNIVGYLDAMSYLSPIYDETYARLSSNEENDLEQLILDTECALKQISTVLIHCMYDVDFLGRFSVNPFPIPESNPLLTEIYNLQLHKISSVTAIHWAQIMSDMVRIRLGDSRPALYQLPTSLNIAEIGGKGRIDFHTVSGYEESMRVMDTFAEVWADTDKNRVQGKEQVLTTYAALIKDYVSKFNTQFQIGLDNARRQASDASVLTASTNKFTQQLLEVSLRLTGHGSVLGQLRTGGMVSVVDATLGSIETADITPSTEPEKIANMRLRAVLEGMHGQTSFHTAGTKDTRTVMGVTRVHDPVDPRYTIKVRRAIKKQHLDQIALELLGLERNLSREVVETIKPGYYFNSLTDLQRREAVRIAKKELAVQNKSMYDWYLFINVMTKMDANRVATRYDEWVASNTSLSFIKFVMKKELPTYNLSEEAMDYYKNGPRLNV